MNEFDTTFLLTTMYRIPQSNLIDYRILNTINKIKGLNKDIINYIKTFIRPLIHIRDKDFFWYSLAIETHHIHTLSYDVKKRMEILYGSNHPITKKIIKLPKEFRDPLNHILECYYHEQERILRNGIFIPRRLFYTLHKEEEN